MSAAVHWILYPAKKKWHAWRHGARESACGTLTVAHLRESPATRLADHLDDDAPACGTCRRIIESGSPASSWLGFVVRHLKHEHCTASRRDKEAVAALLAETGPPDDPVALDLWEQVKTLLLTPMRVKTETGREYRRLVGLSEALELLPPRSGNLAAVAATLRAWRHVMGRDDLGYFRADRVIEVMLQVPEAETYLKYLKDHGLEPLGVAFHPNVLARAKKEPSLRGLFNGSADYWKRTADQLNVVTDD